jgi:hypothetical protein
MESWQRAQLDDVTIQIREMYRVADIDYAALLWAQGALGRLGMRAEKMALDPAIKRVVHRKSVLREIDAQLYPDPDEFSACDWRRSPTYVTPIFYPSA